MFSFKNLFFFIDIINPANNSKPWLKSLEYWMNMAFRIHPYIIRQVYRPTVVFLVYHIINKK